MEEMHKEKDLQGIMSMIDYILNLRKADLGTISDIIRQLFRTQIYLTVRSNFLL